MTCKSNITRANDIICKLNTEDPSPNCEIMEQLRCALNVTHLGIWEWDLKNHHITLSDEVYSITGTNPADFDGTINYIINHIIHPDDRQSFIASIEVGLKTETIHLNEYKVIHPQKPLCWIRINGEFMRDENRRPYKLLGTILDITPDFSNINELEVNLNFMKSLIESLPNPIFYKDYSGIYRFCNMAFLNYLGLTADQVIDKDVYDISPKELADVYNKADADLLTTKGAQVYEAGISYADGTLHHVMFSKGVHLDQQNNVLGIVGLIQDITEKKAVEKQVEMLHHIKDVFLEINHNIMTYDSEEALFSALLPKLQAIFSSCTQSAVLHLSEDNRLTITAHCGFSMDDFSDFNIPFEESFIWRDVNGHFTEAHIINDIASYVSTGSQEVIRSKSGKSIQSTLAVPIIINGSLKWFFTFDNENNHAFTAVDRTVADFIREELPLVYRIFELYQRTLSLSRFDALTGLMNRSYFETVFENTMVLSNRNHEELLIVLFDLDGLKKVNDQYGHQAGDAYLKTFSHFLKTNYRNSDSFSRIGGDEFIGLFPNLEKPEILIKKLTLLRKTFQNLEIYSGDIIFKGSFSFGIAHYPNDAIEENKLLQIADINMYKDKSRQNN